MRHLVGHQGEVVSALAGTEPDIPTTGERARTDGASSARRRFALMDPDCTEIGAEGCFELTAHRAVQAGGSTAIACRPGIVGGAAAATIAIVGRLCAQVLAA